MSDTRTAIAAATTVGPVHLTVADLDRSLGYYRESIGLEVLESGARARLGSARADASCSCSSRSPARSPTHGHTGLFHFALLAARSAPTSPAGSRTRRGTRSSSPACPTTS